MLLKLLMKGGLKKQMNSDNLLKVVLFRHGETRYNIEKRLQSPKDSLTEEGKLQVRHSLCSLKRFNFDKILSSDELRAVESAEIISNEIGVPFEQNSMIREKSSGDFSDKLVKEVDWSIVTGTFLEKNIPNGESIKDVMCRAIRFFEILNKFNQNETILVVSHGTFLRVLFSLILNKDVQEIVLNHEFPNATHIVLVRSESGVWNLEFNSLIKKEEKKNG